MSIQKTLECDSGQTDKPGISKNRTKISGEISIRTLSLFYFYLSRNQLDQMRSQEIALKLFSLSVRLVREREREREREALSGCIVSIG